MGSYQALEVIRCLTGFGSPSAGTLVKFDATNNRWVRLALQGDDHCAVCSGDPSDMTHASAPDELQIQPSELHARQQAGETLILLDVREPEERTVASLGGLFIPLGELVSRMNELDSENESEIIVYCHHGVRSLHAVGMLRASGYSRARSLAGGTDRWSLQIDPALPRY